MSSTPASGTAYASWAPYAPYMFYFVVFCGMSTLPWQLFLKRWKPFHTALERHGRYVMYAHGVLTFSIMYVCEPRNLKIMFASSGVEVAVLVKYALLSALVVILWDFFHVHPMSYFNHGLLQCHHLGLFIAIQFGKGWDLEENWTSIRSKTTSSCEDSVVTLQQQVRLDSMLFGWMWAIHSFGLFMRLLKLVGFKYEEDEKSRAVDAIQLLYAAGTVYGYYQYMNAPSQPGLGFGQLSVFGTPITETPANYQSYALCIMLLGRFLINGNVRNVHFLRRVEGPGMAIVFIDQICGFQDGCLRASGIFMAFCLCLLTHTIFFKKVTPRPEKYIGPQHSSELAQFLKEKKAIHDSTIGSDGNNTCISEEIRKKRQSMKDGAGKFWTDKKVKDGTLFSEKWPVFMAIVADDITELTKLLDDGNDLENQICTDWYNSTPLGWAACLGYSSTSCFLLLERGGDPYLKDDNGGSAVDMGCKDPFQCNGKPGMLGSCERFWDDFNKICCRKSPPKVAWNELPMAERICKVIGEL